MGEFQPTAKKFQYETMPAASGFSGRIFQYVGTATAEFTKGYFYLSDGTAWSRVNVQPEGTGPGGDSYWEPSGTTATLKPVTGYSKLDGVNSICSSVSFNLCSLGMTLCSTNGLCINTNNGGSFNVIGNQPLFLSHDGCQGKTATLEMCSDATTSKLNICADEFTWNDIPIGGGGGGYWTKDFGTEYIKPLTTGINGVDVSATELVVKDICGWDGINIVNGSYTTNTGNGIYISNCATGSTESVKIENEYSSCIGSVTIGMNRGCSRVNICADEFTWNGKPISGESIWEHGCASHISDGVIVPKCGVSVIGNISNVSSKQYSSDPPSSLTLCAAPQYNDTEAKWESHGCIYLCATHLYLNGTEIVPGGGGSGYWVFCSTTNTLYPVSDVEHVSVPEVHTSCISSTNLSVNATGSIALTGTSFTWNGNPVVTAANPWVALAEMTDADGNIYSNVILPLERCATEEKWRVKLIGETLLPGCGISIGYMSYYPYKSATLPGGAAFGNNCAYPVCGSGGDEYATKEAWMNGTAYDKVQIYNGAFATTKTASSITAVTGLFV